MNKRFVTSLGGIALSLLLVSCGGQSGGATIPDTPEGAAFRFRSSLMEAIAWKVAQARGMADGTIPVDEALFAKHAQDVAVLAGMIPEGFIPNSAIQGSAALPEIWTNMSDFRQKSMDLQNAAQSLADAARSQGFESAKGMVQAVGQTCGACHRPYRRRQE